MLSNTYTKMQLMDIGYLLYYRLIAWSKLKKVYPALISGYKPALPVAGDNIRHSKPINY